VNGGFEFDHDKDLSNFRKHGLWLSAFTGFEAAPIVLPDKCFEYDEARYRAFGRIDGTGYMIAYTVRDTGLRLISFRRAHEKEMKRYESR
jgi:uncharacterized protein